ncbi:MAG: hypothetical protein IJ894_09675, partial [Bacteroidales bacterium]|nr:hypothetical protein [Bacteroidales bacterium]
RLQPRNMAGCTSPGTPQGVHCEWVLAPALHRSGVLAEHIRVNYPPDATPVSELANYPWCPRAYEYSEEKMNFPIPAQELLRNPNLTQNKAYR